jgi:hypothetical protein
LTTNFKDGGDFSEAVLEGLQVAIERAQWKKGSRHILVHFADAPPHGEGFSGSKEGFRYDNY